MGRVRVELSHGGQVRRLQADGPSITLGQSADCSLVLPFSCLSARHLILQEDPPFLRAKLLDTGARATYAGQAMSTSRWIKLPAGAVLHIPTPDGPPLEIRLKPPKSASAVATQVQAPSHAELGPDEFGVVFATDSALDGRSGGWLDPQPAESSFTPQFDGFAPQPRQPINRGRIVGWVGGVMAVLVISAVAFAWFRGSAREEALRADLEAVRTGIARSDDLIVKQQYVAAKAELDSARAVAAKWPSMAEKMKVIDGLLARPVIQKGAAGQLLVDGQWVPGDTARGVLAARQLRDNPKIAALEAKVAAAIQNKRWEEGRTACEEAIALVEKHPMPHPRRPALGTTLQEIKDGAEAERMLAQGFVKHENQWVTVAKRDELVNTAKGLELYKTKWMTKEEAFAARQRDNGFVFQDGRWMTADEVQIAQGNVRFDNRWMRPQERDALIEQRAAEAQRKRELADAEARKNSTALNTAQQEAARIDQLKEEAYKMSQEFVKDKLPDPNGAKFDAFTSSNVVVTYTDGWFLVSGVVRARGASGMTNMTYLCRLQFKNNTWIPSQTIIQQN